MTKPVITRKIAITTLFKILLKVDFLLFVLQQFFIIDFSECEHHVVV